MSFPIATFCVLSAAEAGTVSGLSLDFRCSEEMRFRNKKWFMVAMNSWQYNSIPYLSSAFPPVQGKTADVGFHQHIYQNKR